MEDFFLKIAILIVKLWIKTVSFNIIGLEKIKELKSNKEKIVFAIWHGQLALFYPMSNFIKGCGIVSKSKDGELATKVIKRFGFESVRGSSSKDGAVAIIEAEKYLTNGYDIIVTVDGPKGPRLKVKNGVVYIAKKFKCKIIPVVMNINRYKMFKSWDHFLFPLPFSKISLYIGDPIEFQSSTDKETVKNEVKQLEKIMLEMTERYANFYL